MQRSAITRIKHLSWLLLGLSSLTLGCDQETEDEIPASAAGQKQSTVWEQLESIEEVPEFQLTELDKQSVVQFCSDCHALPKPSAFEKTLWYEKVLRGYEFYARSGRGDLAPPPVAAAVRYFRAQAPSRIEFPAPGPLDRDWASRFTIRKLDWADGNRLDPAIAAIEWLTVRPAKTPRLLVSDMRDGSVSLITPHPEQSQVTRQVIGRLGSPARFAVRDVNEDGLDDIVVAELGSLNPYDHGFGKLVLFEQSPAGEFQARTLLKDRGRIADLFFRESSDGESLDIFFAEFGHRRAGGVFALRNWQAGEQQVLRLDGRPGTVRLIPGQWDADQDQDFIALVTQEYESVELFHGRTSVHTPSFNRQLLTSGNLTDGSVGLHSADLDGDGDRDLLYTHGDCFDDNHAQRNHGLDLLVNEGAGEFRRQPLYNVPGAYQTVASDFDGDADLDILLVANLPASVAPASLGAQRLQTSIVLLEQIAPLEFEPHILEQGVARYSAVACGDFNFDGKNDFVVGTQLLSADAQLPRLSIWWNGL